MNSVEKDRERHHMSADQVQIIICFMQDHSEFCRNKLLGADAKNTKRKLWIKLSEAVSKVGHKKSVEQVKNFWQKLKQKVKFYRANRVMEAKTGNNTDKKIPINTMFEQVLAIVGTSHGNGLPIVEEVGFKNRAVANCSGIKDSSKIKDMKKATVQVKKYPSIDTSKEIFSPIQSFSSRVGSSNDAWHSDNSNNDDSMAYTIPTLLTNVEKEDTYMRKYVNNSMACKKEAPSSTVTSPTCAFTEEKSKATSKYIPSHINDLNNHGISTPVISRKYQKISMPKKSGNRVIYTAPAQVENEYPKMEFKENAYKTRYANYASSWATKPNQTVLRSQETLAALQNNSNALNEMSFNIAKLTEANIKKNDLLTKQVYFLQKICQQGKKKKNREYDPI